MNARDARLQGFTLIELLVSLFITAVILLIGYGTIQRTITDREVIDAREQRLTAIQTAMRIMVQDFAQLTPRPVRDETGNGSLPCLLGNPAGLSIIGEENTLGGASDGQASQGSSDLDLVAFTRAGWANAEGSQRPAEERVAYRLVKGVLERESWPELDVTESTPIVTRKLLKHVKSISFSYLDQTRQWLDQWPPPTYAANAGRQALRMRPLAVRITLVLDDWGKIVRIIEVAT